MIFKRAGRLRRSYLLASALAVLGLPVRAAAAAPLAAATWRIGEEPLRLAAGPGFAGAISSIRFRGREFLDAADHGRELQGAVQFGSGECLNPTLAGASRDPPGRSSSQVLSIQVSPSRYRAATRMAFWNRPGEPCALGPDERGVALNRSDVSDLVYSQDMTQGYMGHPDAVLVRIGVANPHARPPASVEALTGYMPPDFDTFILYDPQADGFREEDALRNRSGERDDPLILSTADGRSAMGVIGLSTSTAPRYAGFHSAAVGKWSLVYHAAVPFAPGLHRYVCVWIIGTRREVEDTLADIVHRRAAGTSSEEALLVLLAGGALFAGGWVLVERERRRRRRPLVPL